MSFFDDASLVFLPSGEAGKDGKAYSMKPTNGNGDFTFSRGSNLTATRVDSNGLIEKGRENLLFQSNQFDTTWTTSGSPSLSSGQSGYDGSTDAWLYTNNGSEYIYQDETTNVATYSIFAKKGNGGIGDFVLLFTDGVGGRYFDLDNGVLGSEVLTGLIDSKIELVSGTTDWYRCSITFASSTRVRVYASLADNDFASVASIYIQDAQLEQGLVATEYIESGTATGKAGILEHSPRFDYSGGASCPSLLLEPSRTNLIGYSEYANGNGWVIISSGTIVDNVDTSPEGVVNAFSFETTTFGALRYNVTLSTSTTYTFSFYAKNVDATRAANYRVFNNDTATDLVPQTSYLSQLSTTEWKRISLTFTTNATNTGYSVYVTSGNQEGTILFYGAQLEQGSYPTSYIPNHSGGSVTRAAEVNTTANISSVIGQQEGTFFLDFEFLDGTTAENQNWIALESEDGQSRVLFYKGASTNNLRLLITADNIGVFSKSNLVAISPNTRYKVAVRYNSRDQGVAANGSMVGSNGTATYTITSLLSRVKFNESNIQPSCKVHQAIVFDSGLTDSELENLTS